MLKNEHKKSIAVDIDDVIAAEAEFIVEYSNKHWGHNLTLDDYKEHWGEMWQVDHEEVERRADIIHTPGLIRSYRILEHAHRALKELSKNYKLVILTSRRGVVKQETIAWLEENFGDVFSEVHFTGFWDNRDPDAHQLTKADLSKEIGADYIIDDQPKHCFGAAEVGVQAILFGDYAESRGLSMPSGVTRCRNWREVLEFFENEQGR